jgi:hypothetical protein
MPIGDVYQLSRLFGFRHFECRLFEDLEENIVCTIGRKRSNNHGKTKQDGFDLIYWPFSKLDVSLFFAGSNHV